MNAFSFVPSNDVDCNSHSAGGSLVTGKLQQDYIYSECNEETHPYVHQSTRTFTMIFENCFQIVYDIRFSMTNGAEVGMV